MTEFRADAVPLADDAALLSLHGTIGALDIDDLRALALDAQAARFVIDTTAASVEDPGAVELLLDLARRAGAGEPIALVVPAGGDLDRVLATTGLEAAFAVYADLRSALDDLDLPPPDVR